MVVIRRELPRTVLADLGPEAGRIGGHEDSPFRVPLRPLTILPHARSALYPVIAAASRSAWVAMAQMKPSSSRATAVTALPGILPFEVSRQYRLFSRC